jgi:hypothetical protein
MVISDQAHEIIDKAAKRLEERRDDYEVARRYHDGEHPQPPATERWTRQLQEAFDQIRDNLMPLVVEALVSRLKVSGFAPEVRTPEPEPTRSFTYPQGRPTDADRAFAEFATSQGRPRPGEKAAEAERRRADELWAYNRMDAKQREVHEESAKKGDAYVIVWSDPLDDRARIHPNDAELVDVEYDPEAPDRMLWAVKRWVADDRVRATIYYGERMPGPDGLPYVGPAGEPTRIEKYVSVRPAGQVKSKTAPDEWEPYQPTELAEVIDPDLGVPRTGEVPTEPWPLPNPYGRVPVFHFPNKGKTGGYGVSELKQLAPLQDALNKEFQSLLLTSEQYGAPWRYIAGMRPEVDEETGRPKPIDFKPWLDNILAIWGEGVAVGQFAAAELAQHVGVINDLRAEIGRLSQTPPHMLFLITGEIPSGEALKVVESPFTAKVEDRQVFWGNTWEDVLAFAVKVDADLEVRYSVEWEDTQPRSMLEIAQTGEAWLRLGVPRRVVWKRLLHATDGECDEWEQLRLEERAMEPLPPVAFPGEQGDMLGQPPNGPPPGRTPPQLEPYAQRTKAMVGQAQPQQAEPPPRRRPRARR